MTTWTLTCPTRTRRTAGWTRTGPVACSPPNGTRCAACSKTARPPARPIAWPKWRARRKTTPTPLWRSPKKARTTPSRRACETGWTSSSAHCTGWTRAPTAGRSAAANRSRTSAWKPTPPPSSPSRKPAPPSAPEHPGTSGRAGRSGLFRGRPVGSGGPAGNPRRDIGVRVAAVSDEPLQPGRAGQLDPGQDELGLAPAHLHPADLLVAHVGRGQAELPADALHHRGARPGVGVEAVGRG